MQPRGRREDIKKKGGPRRRARRNSGRFERKTKNRCKRPLFLFPPPKKNANAKKCKERERKREM
jgi:hypothetical protein